jgi:hypothetical protein
VREAIGLVFARFAEMQSIRQVFLSLRADRIALPYIDQRRAGDRRPLWKVPAYATVNNLLTNPVYAGAYAFGRTGSRTTIEDGRKRVLRGHRKDRSEWAVLLVDHHEGYLSWAEYERNQRLIADNANGKGMMVRGPVRKGEALLAGLVRCGHCGRRLLVSYNGAKGDVGRYSCDAVRNNPGAAPCISGRVPLDPRGHPARSEEPQPLRRFACARSLLRPRPARRRRPAARGRLRPAAAAGAVRPRSRQASGSLTQTASFGSTEADILPSRPADRQSAARKRSPGGRAAAPARSAGAQRPGRREHGARLEWSGRRWPCRRTRPFGCPSGP